MAVFGRRKVAKETLPVSAAPAGTVAPAVVAADAIEPQEDEKSDGQDLTQIKTTATTDIVYPEGLRLALLLISVFSSLFLVSLDRLIISTAIPQITDDFKSVTDIGWYGSAYLLTNCAFQLLFGKFYGFFSVKWVILSAIFLFEVGSALCGAAPSSTAFIVGRAIAGLGSAGILSGIIVVLVYAVPLHKRPLYQGLFGAVFGLSSIIGPLVGGAFTSHVTWRWCFYINLPFGGVAMFFIFLLLEIPDRKETHLPLKDKMLQLDLFGTTALLPGCICLLLALQWGGLEYAWSSWRIVLLLVLACVLLVAFILIQIFKPDTATVPPRIFLQRSIMAGFFSTICTGSQMMLVVYYLPIWFQAIKGVNALDSGIRLLPMILPMVFGSITTGILVSRIGYYTPFMIWGVCLMSIGAGLLTTLQVDTNEAKWVGYQILYGYGMGCTFQAPNLAAQTVLPNKDVPIGTSLMFFSQLLGGAIFLSVGQNVFDNQLLSRLGGLQGFNPELLLSTGATTLLAELPDSIRPAVLLGYNEALRKVFQVALILVCLTILGAAALEWRSVKKNVQKKDGEGEDGAAEKGRHSDDATVASLEKAGSAANDEKASTGPRRETDSGAGRGGQQEGRNGGVVG